jgi:hypothetical protein
MGALMEKRRGADRVVASVVAGDPDVDVNLVDGFTIGVRDAVPAAAIPTVPRREARSPKPGDRVAKVA